MRSKYTFVSLIDEILQLSASPPAIVNALRTELIRHYTKATIMVSHSYPEPIAALYSLNDNEMYSLISLSFADDKDVFFLLPAQDIPPHKVVKAFLAQLKMRNNYTGAETMEVVKNITVITHALHEALTSSTRTTRRAVGNNGKNVAVLPSMIKLKVFYECGRKKRYSSSEEAKNDLDIGNDTYACDHCGGYHQGKQPTGQSIPRHIMEGRYTTAWRRYYHI